MKLPEGQPLARDLLKKENNNSKNAESADRPNEQVGSGKQSVQKSDISLHIFHEFIHWVVHNDVPFSRSAA
jgi:hypothetical protein